MSLNWTVAVGSERTSATLDPAGPAREQTPTGDHLPASADAVFVCAHGAGGHLSDRGMLALSSVLHAKGLSIVRFNFLYREKRSGRPDPMPRLEECFSAVVDRVRSELAPKLLIIGGRSMGGRTATMMAAKGFDCDGLVLFAYPLHPAGQPEKLRDSHLTSIKVPVLCFNGTRDALCTPDLMKRALEPVTTRWDMHWLEGADHSFHVLKSSGRTDAQILDEVADATDAWVHGLKR